MARMTKIELTQQNTRLAEENAALRAQLSQALADNARLTERVRALEDDEDDRAYERAVIAAETTKPVGAEALEEGRAAFFSLSRVERAALSKVACEQLGVRSVTPATAGLFLLTTR